jgi:RNA recognition motif-containing protein
MAIKLFVGGLSFSTTNERLRETFATLGSVQSAQVVMGPDGRSRGFGFVEMDSLEEAEAAIRALDRSTLDGRTITVERAVGRGAPARGVRVGGSGRG